MRFSVDAHAIGRHLTGNEVYIRSLLERFSRIDDRAEFIAYVAASGLAARIPERVAKRRISGNPFVRLGFDLSSKLREDRPDLLHVQYTAPLGCPVPFVVSVHDVSFLEHPEYFPFPRALQLRLTVERTVRSAERILTGSEFSRQAIARAYCLEADRISVVPNAASSDFRPLPRSIAAPWLRERFQITAPYLLTVGDLQPRKNQIGLIRAYAEMIRAYPQLPHHLVLAGKETWFSSRIRSAATDSDVADRIHLVGFVTDDDLLRLYNGCDVFVFPSFYEGFGLPVLEAMACGRAVACSNTSALPEVADSAALLFDPHSTAEMTRAMLDLVLDTDLRSRMERLGTQRASQFSWQKTAEKTLEVYYDVAYCRQRARVENVSAASVSRS